ncbi:hypothetical protein BS47DRAFT_316957 [Hydnum rufescens UP504]|uniref:Uncharacterized protein n=1 Tax=Hydnum rufescens UP504 TaxID=1448309 RepID=A0A9P6AK79_9AGAM|nr:hypothetical protein BS47DRAFT_316957 [Hydnum rufescens UP504]
MPKKISILTQTLLVAVTVWIWQIGRPVWKEFTLSFRNGQTTISTPGYYFAGDANKTCEIVTRPDPSKISHCEDGVRIGDKKLLISCDPGRPNWNPVMGIMTNSRTNGSLWIYDYGNNDSLQPVELVGFPAGRTFHPLGVNVFRKTPAGPVHAFVANLEAKASAVEVFTILDKAPYKAFYERTLSHPLIHAPNAVLPVSPTQLYVSIDHRFTGRMSKWIAKLSFFEDFLQAPLGWVAYVEILPNGKVKYSKAANFINFANGLFLSRDGREFAVVSSVRSILSFYDRDPRTSKLTFREKIQLPYPPDNLRPDSEGNIIVSGSANLLHLGEFAYGAVHILPAGFPELPAGSRTTALSCPR